MHQWLPREFTADAAYREARVTERELAWMVDRAGMSVVARAEIPGRFPYATNAVLRLRRNV